MENDRTKRTAADAMDHFKATYMSGEVLTPSEPEYKFSRTDGKVQIFSVVHNVQMFAGSGKGSSVQNFVAEVDDEDAAHALLDRIDVPRKNRPERT